MDDIFRNIDNMIIYLYNLPVITKIFITGLIFVFLFFILKNKESPYSYYSFENYDNLNETNELDLKKKFISKIDDDVYDNFYAKYYDRIHFDRKKNEFEIENLLKIIENKEDTKILDVGCGTGNHVYSFDSREFDIIGLDKSKAMIIKAEEKFPKCNFIQGDILNNELFDFGSFSHILCLNMTIYQIVNKDKFFENCYTLLSNEGMLIVHLVEREKFEPYVSKDNKTVLYDPNNYYKTNLKQEIVKFDENNEYISKYYLLNNNNDNNKPYSMYKETFKNFNTNKVRDNEINLFIPKLEEVIKIAKRNNFKYSKRINMESINYNNQYLYVFTK